jgi:hypothetical protein
MKRLGLSLLWLIGIVALAGCGPLTPTPGSGVLAPTLAPTAALPTATAAPTLTALPTLTLATTKAASATAAPSPTATVAPTAAPTKTPAANPVGPALNATPIAVNCATFPGFPTCPAALPLTGRLAAVDAGAAHIVIYDFNNKLVQAVPVAGSVQKLEWVDKGNYLISYDNSGKPALAWANPVLSKSPPVVTLSPAGTPIFSAADGSTAWMDATFNFHVKLATSTQEQVWPAEPAPSDKIHELLGWVPGTTLLLAGYHFGDNSMWITGNRLYTLDTRNGKVTPLNANLKLGGAFQWSPSQSGLMVFGDSSQAAGMGAGRLAVLDVVNGKLVAPIADASVTSTYPSWMADGKAILHAASKPGVTPAAGDPFALAAIYLTQYPAGTSQRLTQPPSGARDDWPQMLADGAHFLFMRTASDGQTAELRLGALDGSPDKAVANGVTLPAPSPFGTRWESVLAFAP